MGHCPHNRAAYYCIHNIHFGKKIVIGKYNELLYGKAVCLPNEDSDQPAAKSDQNPPSLIL